VTAIPPSVTEVLVVNQHGDNRGDEAAMLAMLGGLRARLGACRFTVVAQVQEPGAGFPVPADTTFLPAVPGFGRLVALVVVTLAAVLRRPPPRRLLDRTTRRLVEAYERADLVISAPGGPYFGDLYWRHEPLHWWYAWLGIAHRTPTFLFAPSAGPYGRRTWNLVRARLLRRFSSPLCVREDVSAAHLAALVGPGAPVEVTTDAALLEHVPPLDRSRELGAHAGRFLVAVSAYDGGGPAYDAAFRAGIRHLATTRDTHFVVLPQRYGAAPDVAYLEQLLAPLAGEVSWQLFDPSRDARAQRGLVAAADLVLAGRYHPLVFAVSAHVPVVPIAYEHKATGVARAAGIGDVALTVEGLTAPGLVAAIDEVISRSAALRATLTETEPRLHAAAGRTADLAAALVGRDDGGRAPDRS
jgi:colanic acid/amylovoran biosynthesis protein